MRMSKTLTTPNSLVKSESSLVQKNDLGYFIENHPDFLESAKFILKSANQLLQTGDSALVIPNDKRQLRVIRLSKRPLENLERFLVKKCANVKEAFFTESHQSIYDHEANLIGKSTRPYLLAPLMVDHKILLGVLILEDKITTGKFVQEDLSLVTAFCKTFGRLIYSTIKHDQNGTLLVNFTSNLLTLLENLYLYKSNLENNFLLSEMIKVSKMINSTLDLQSLLESIMESAKLVLKTESASLMLIDNKTNELYFNIISAEKEKALKEIRIPMGVGIAGIVAQNREALIVNNAQEDERIFKEADEKINFVTRNLIATPLMVRNRIIGVIEVINSVGREEFTEKDLELFKTFSEQAALAINNREMIDSLKQLNMGLKKKVHELSSLHEISKSLISNINEKDLFDSVVRIISDELQADRVSLMLYNEDENVLEIISSFGLNLASSDYVKVPIDGTLSGLVFRENRIIHTNNIDNSPYATFRNNERYLTGACILHPLNQGDTVYGLINIAEKSDGTRFSDDDFRLGSTIASQITKGVQSFKLIQEMIEKKSYERELEITSQIQKSILPDKKLESPFFDMGVISMPAKMMGGDFYDYYAFDAEHFAFSVADVSGKSLPAALFMAVTNSIIRTIGRDGFMPGELLLKANDLIYQDSQAGMFVTLFFMLYNAKSRELKFSSGGHNEQLIYRHDSQEFEQLHAKGSPLGVLPTKMHGEFGEGIIYLQPSDILVLYTDGVIEAINEKREEFGLENLKRLIVENHLLTADQIVKRVFREVSDFAGTEPQFDDFTLMIIKILK